MNIGLFCVPLGVCPLLKSANDEKSRRRARRDACNTDNRARRFAYNIYARLSMARRICAKSIPAKSLLTIFPVNDDTRAARTRIVHVTSYTAVRPPTRGRPLRARVCVCARLCVPSHLYFSSLFSEATIHARDGASRGSLDFQGIGEFCIRNMLILSNGAFHEQHDSEYN